MDRYNLLDEFRIRGKWWLPNTSEEERIPGTLTYDPESGVRLELDGVFNLPDFSMLPLLSKGLQVRLNLVLGIDTEGEPYTLHQSDAVKLSDTSVFRVSYLLAGRHYHTVDELSFHSAVVQYTHLESWSSFQFSQQASSTPPGCISLVIPVTPTTQFKSGEVGPIQELSLTSYALPHFRLGLVEVKPGSRFDLTFKDPLGLRKVLSLTNDLGQLITMLVGDPCYLTRLWICGPDQPSVAVFYPSTIRKGAVLHPAEMCFSLPAIGNVAELTEKWFASLPTLEPVYDLLFGTLFQRDAYVTTKFLNLSQALESFHRRTVGGIYIPAADFSNVLKQVCDAIPKIIPDALKKKISDSLKYANEYSLRKRVKELINSLDTKTIEMLRITDVASTADLLVKTRNYLTHFDDESKTKLVDDIVAMHYMNERLTALLFILILKNLGMQESTATAGVIRRRFFG